MSPRPKKKRLRKLHAIRSDLFRRSFSDCEVGFSPVLVQIDRAISVLEILPLEVVDPNVLGRDMGGRPVRESASASKGA